MINPKKRRTLIQSDLISIYAVAISFIALCTSAYSIFDQNQQKKIDNLVTVHEFLHANNLSESRRLIREQQTELTLSNHHVREVCSAFDFAATLVHNGALDQNMFFEYWGGALVDLHKNLRELGELSTGPNMKVREYYKEFWWLMDEAVRRQQK